MITININPDKNQPLPVENLRLQQLALYDLRPWVCQ